MALSLDCHILKRQDRKVDLFTLRNKPSLTEDLRKAKWRRTMKKNILVAAITMIVMAMAEGAFAQSVPTDWTNQTVLINATVSASCTNFSAGNMTLGIDPSTSTPVYSTGNLTTVQCTKTTPFYVSALSAGTGGVANTTGTLSGKLTAVSPATNSPIPYTLYFTPSFTGSGFGSATATTLITGNGDSSHGVNVAATDAQAAQAGTYSDTVTLSVSY